MTSRRISEIGSMPFQTPITIHEALSGIQEGRYVLPAIQREFVWSEAQITQLFDSLLREYPIGSFLFWTVDPDTTASLRFYGFLKDYHELTNRYCPVEDIPPTRQVTAILDGQQRLTSLNIGLRGSYAVRLPRAWAKNPLSYPTQHLYVNLLADAPENDQGVVFDFRFFSSRPASTAKSHWYRVADIYDSGQNMLSIHKYLVAHDLGNQDRPMEVLLKLHAAVHTDAVINFYVERDQNIDRVLDIFIRVNSAGTVLSYSDLLLSIATAQWSVLDARDEVHGLVDELNAIGQGFAFDKDVVLKSGLVLTEVSDVGFKVSNFNRTNMATLETQWIHVKDCLRLAVGLLSDFGFNWSNLTANSVVIPIAYYVHKARLDESYRTASRHLEDRRSLRSWILRSLIKPGVWGSGLDTLLRDLRRVIRDENTNGFPLAAVEAAMVFRGKDLAFSDAEIDDLLRTSYKHRRVFPLISLLFPQVNTRNIHHVDHIYPQKFFRSAKLIADGLTLEQAGETLWKMDELPNLQLLEGPENLEKRAQPPRTWAEKAHGPHLETYLADQELTGLGDSMSSFPKFFEMRRARFGERLRQLLGAAVPSTN
jgi:hypothetical protein